MSRRPPATAARRRHRARHAPVATITEVAARARVSIATVSRVFADTGRVSRELRDRVRDAARTLGYQPSRVARSLRVGSTLAVGVVIPDVQNPFFTGVVRGIEEVLLEAGYTLLLANADEEPEREGRMLATLRAEGVAGIVFVPIGRRTSTYGRLARSPFPIVAVDRLPAGLQVDLVTVDNREATRRAIEYLIGLGHRRVALIGGPPHHSTALERREGYELALGRAGLTARPELMPHGDFREPGGYRGMRTLLALRRRPTAVFVANNLMTLGALRALHEAGLAIPDDISLAGFDDMPWATSLNPPLTAVAQPAHEMGAAATELLLARISDPDRPVRHVVLDTRLEIRASCGEVKERTRAASS
jgi:DNA-binding LacI/PurR family transcriptional regulator